MTPPRLQVGTHVEVFRLFTDDLSDPDVWDSREQFRGQHGEVVYIPKEYNGGVEVRFPGGRSGFFWARELRQVKTPP
jgi:hypothetical protein